MFCHVSNIRNARSLAVHLASITHSQPTTEEQNATGVTDARCDFSVGIDDILADIKRGLKAASWVAKPP